MLLSKEEFARKRIHIACSVRTENSVTWDNCLASLVMPNAYPRDGIFNPPITIIKDSYILIAVHVPCHPFLSVPVLTLCHYLNNDDLPSTTTNIYTNLTASFISRINLSFI